MDIMKMIQRNIKWVVLSVLLILATAILSQAQTHRTVSKPKVQTATVLITEQGYSRASINLRRGVPTRITFLRQTDNTCATEVVIAAFGVNRPLPLNQRVIISFTPKNAGEFSFTCGMKMMRGKLIVQ